MKVTTNVTAQSEGHAENRSIQTRLVQLALVRTDCGTQSRAAINQEIVDEYAERMVEGDKFPPADVFFDGNDYYLADGFHRILAAHRNGLRDFECRVRPGTVSDALWFAIGSNRQNGACRSTADKRRAVELAIEKFPDRSNRCVAHHVGCSETYVRKVQDGIQLRTSAQLKHARVTGKDGKRYRATKPRCASLTRGSAQAPAQSEPEPTPAAVPALPAPEPPRVPTLQEEINDILSKEPVPGDRRSEMRYHVDLVLEDAKIILDQFDTNTLDPKALEEAATQQFYCAKMLKSFAKTLSE